MPIGVLSPTKLQSRSSLFIARHAPRAVHRPTGAQGLDSESVRAAKKYNLRRIVILMIVETACHTGHADVMPELLDGQTGG
jgi:hypothetical protein